MSGNTIYRDFTPPLKKTAYCQQAETPVVGQKLTRSGEDMRRADEYIRTVNLKSSADGGGLTYSLKTPQECGNYDPTQKVVVRELTPEEQRLSPVGYELSAQRGAVSDPFFYIDTAFIARHAKAIASGEEYSTDYASYDNTPAYFYQGIAKWFGEKNVESLKSSTEALCREYAGRMETGGSLDLHSLETTFDIRGERLTLGQLLDMRDMAKLLSGSCSQKYEASIQGIQIGSDQSYMCAMKGLLRAAAGAYADTLPETLGQAFEEGFCRLYDSNMQKCIEFDRDYQKSVSGWERDNYDWLVETSEKAYADFSKLDFSGKAAAQSSFTAALDAYDKMLKDGGETYFSKIYCRNITEVFNRVCGLLPV